MLERLLKMLIEDCTSLILLSEKFLSEKLNLPESVISNIKEVERKIEASKTGQEGPGSTQIRFNASRTSDPNDLIVDLIQGALLSRLQM